MKVSSKGKSPAKEVMTKWAKTGKKSKKKFKRSLTMTALPMSFFKSCSNNSSPNPNDLNRPPSATVMSSNNNNTEQNVTKFTIGKYDLVFNHAPLIYICRYSYLRK